MVLDVRGSLGPVQSTLELDDKDITQSKVTATVDVTKIYTREAKRDDHLRSADFLNAEKWPTLSFKSTKVTKAGANKLKVTGDLTIKDITKPVTLDVELSNEIIDPFTKATKRAVTATGSFKRADYNMTWNMPLANNTGVVVGEEVNVTLDLEFVKKEGKQVAGGEKEAPKK